MRACQRVFDVGGMRGRGVRGTYARGGLTRTMCNACMVFYGFVCETAYVEKWAAPPLLLLRVIIRSHIHPLINTLLTHIKKHIYKS